MITIIAFFAFGGVFDRNSDIPTDDLWDNIVDSWNEEVNWGYISDSDLGWTNIVDDSEIDEIDESVENEDSGAKLIRNYFELWNAWRYREACDLMTKSRCNSGNGTANLDGFSNFWERLDGWYNVLKVYKSEKQPTTGDQTVYCVEYEYKLKQDTSPYKVQEIFQYRLAKKDDGKQEITVRVCESKVKWWVQWKCPTVTPKLYCD